MSSLIHKDAEIKGNTHTANTYTIRVVKILGAILTVTQTQRVDRDISKLTRRWRTCCLCTAIQSVSEKNSCDFMSATPLFMLPKRLVISTCRRFLTRSRISAPNDGGNLTCVQNTDHH